MSTMASQLWAQWHAAMSTMAIFAEVIGEKYLLNLRPETMDPDARNGHGLSHDHHGNIGRLFGHCQKIAKIGSRTHV